MKFVLRFSAAALVACLMQIAPAPASAQANRTANTPVFTGTRVAVEAGSYSGPLYVVAGGRETRIAADAIAAWIIDGGRKVVYSGRDGAGGYENEGQSLRIYDARTGRHRKVMSEYFEVDTVTEVAVGAKIALLVAMSDSGLGASNVAVVDPARGEVFFRPWARVDAREGAVIVVGHYTEDDWSRLAADANARVTPYKTERHDLAAIIRRPVRGRSAKLDCLFGAEAETTSAADRSGEDRTRAARRRFARQTIE